MPHNPSDSVSGGAMPIIETRRGMRGAMLHGLWIPLPISGGDGTEGDPPPPPPPNPAPPPAGDPPKEMAGPEALATIQKLRDELKEAKAQGKEVETLKAKLQEHEDAKLSETERLQKERDEAVTKAEQAEAATRDRIDRAEVRIVASELGFTDVDDAWRFIPRDAIEHNEDGEPTNVKALLDKLVKDKPYLLKSPDGKAAVPPTPKGGNGQLSREELIEDKKKKLLAARL